MPLTKSCFIRSTADAAEAKKAAAELVKAAEEAASRQGVTEAQAAAVDSAKEVEGLKALAKGKEEDAVKLVLEQII